jgi:hypothetical protein
VERKDGQQNSRAPEKTFNNLFVNRLQAVQKMQAAAGGRGRGANGMPSPAQIQAMQVSNSHSHAIPPSINCGFSVLFRRICYGSYDLEGGWVVCRK